MSENKYVKRFLNPASIWAIIWALFQIWIVFRGSFSALVLRPIHVGFAIGLVFLTQPMFKKNKVPKGQKYMPKWYEYIFVALDLMCIIHMCVNSERIMSRMVGVDALTTMDIVVGVVLILLLLECSRRAVNMALTIIVLVFLAYGFFGNMLPGLLGHTGHSLSAMLENQVYSTGGIFGSPVSVSVSMVFYFLLFGAFLSATPAGQLFINISNLLTRKTTGGAGKATVVACAFFGMISGSAPANVASVGTIMYPSLKKEKFDPTFSGSILAIGGTAGQLIPPVMGAAAFIMVDMVGTSYSQVMLSAVLPSIIFMMAMYFLVHFYAKKHRLSAPVMDVAQVKKDIMKHLHLLLSIVVLVAMILSGRSMMRAATLSAVVLIVLTMIRKDTRLNLYTFLETLESTAKQAVIVVMPCALAGIIVGEIVSTGLGLRFSSMINMVAQNSLLIALMLTMLMALILGMGMPTSAAYIMAATLLAPTMVNLGVEAIVAHFFVFYFANLSMITPPVALSSFAAAGIVGVDMWKLGLAAFKYSFVIFIIPYAFVYSPAMLGFGTVPEIIQIAVFTILGIYAVGCGLIGYGLAPINKLERLVLIVAAVMLIVPELISSVIGTVILAASLALQYQRRKKLPPSDGEGPKEEEVSETVSA